MAPTVMSLAVLPGRLNEELDEIAVYLTPNYSESIEVLSDTSHQLHKHKKWVLTLVDHYGHSHSFSEAKTIVLQETGAKFLEVLMDAAVFKRTTEGKAAFRMFLLSIGLRKV
ncbi:hypothetical protein L3i20_v206460 [Paenibacillus sp. L3-i20]|nr:hypothetical protein L3i20_v206460 [Paenibacillus sp. L3-i20]